MAFPRMSKSGLCMLAGLMFAVIAQAQNPAPSARSRSSSETPPFRTKTSTSQAAARLVPVDALNPNLRERVKMVLSQPTLVTHGAYEEFVASVDTYKWLMNHPDRAALAWQRLGVNCSPITDRGQGRFGWSDDLGSEVIWSIIADGPAATVWYAEGQVRPGRLAPTIPVKSVVVMRHQYPDKASGKIGHEIDIFCHADSRAAAIAYRMFGPSTDRMAQQAAEQLLTFFSSISKYLAKYPDQADQLLSPVARASSQK